MNISNRHFPVEDVLPQVKTELAERNICILSAPPGAGKTTVVPAALMNEEWLKGQKIIMLEPRRIAARRAAEFISSARGEECGHSVGYRIRSESCVSLETRLEIVTEGILTRMIQDNPELPGIGALIFDEFHERSIHADTGLAFAYDVYKNLRPDLRILIMSATLDSAMISELLDNAAVIESHGHMYPVEVRYQNFPSDNFIGSTITDTVKRLITREEGDILIFLPGKYEINKTESLLWEKIKDSDIVIHKLYGELPRTAQDAALNPDNKGRRKIILATSMAETSLTIDGVRIVIDSGLSRISSFDPRRGMGGLITIPSSKATAEQRKGRAGRLMPGICCRMMTEKEFALLPDFQPAEILSTDLAPLALELAAWGTADGEGLAFLNTPPIVNLNQAQSLLHELGAIDSDRRITGLGRKMHSFPLHPRYSSMIIHAKQSDNASAACLLAALLAEKETLSKISGSDISEIWHRLFYPDRSFSSISEKVFAQSDRLRKIADVKSRPTQKDECELGILLATAYPDRIAKRKSDSQYQLSQGTIATLPANSPLNKEEYIAVADADYSNAIARIFLAAPVKMGQLISAFEDLITETEITEWKDERVKCSVVKKLRSIILSEKQQQASDRAATDCIINMIKKEGLGVLPWNAESRSLIARFIWYSKIAGTADMPELSDEALISELHIWLAPFLAGILNSQDLARLNMKEIISSMFSYEQMKELDNMAPASILLPSGSRVKLNYEEGEKPVLAVRLQELFGQTETPVIANGKAGLLIHLLSPAMRPLSVTQDLKSFWLNTYPGIVKQMRVKYPRHVWPDDPLNAIPTSRTKPRR